MRLATAEGTPPGLSRHAGVLSQSLPSIITFNQGFQSLLRQRLASAVIPASRFDLLSQVGGFQELVKPQPRQCHIIDEHLDSDEGCRPSSNRGIEVIFVPSEMTGDDK
jgi:hypothetical protein